MTGDGSWWTLADVARFTEALEGLEAFRAEMRELGVHMGLGVNGVVECVLCEVPWPCPDEQRARAERGRE